MANLLDIRMHDGSRHFGDLPETGDWDALHAHLKTLSGIAVTAFVTDHVTEAWINFRYRGHKFAANNQCGDWWFFVDDPTCGDTVLNAVLDHCRKLLGSR